MNSSTGVPAPMVFMLVGTISAVVGALGHCAQIAVIGFLGGLCSLVAVVAAVLEWLKPGVIHRILVWLNEDSSRKSATVSVRADPKRRVEFVGRGSTAEYSPWNALAIFAALSCAGIYCGKTMLEDARAQNLVAMVSLLPVLFALFSAHSFSMQAYDTSAKLLMRAGLATVTMLVVIVLLVIAEHQLGKLEEFFEQIFR